MKSFRVYHMNLATSRNTDFSREEIYHALEVMARLVVLAVMYREFCQLVWDKYGEPDYYNWADELGLSAFRMGQLVGSDFKSLDDDDFYLRGEALQFIVERLRDGVYRALIDHFGNNSMLFASLYATLWRPPGDDYICVKEPGKSDEEESDEDLALYEDEADFQGQEEWTIEQILKDENALDDILNDIDPGKMCGFEWIEERMPSLSW